MANMGMGSLGGPGDRRKRLVERKSRQQGSVNALKTKQAEQNKKNMKGAPGCEQFDDAKPKKKEMPNFLYKGAGEGKQLKDTKLVKGIKKVGNAVENFRINRGEKKVARTQRKIEKLDKRTATRTANKETRMANKTARQETRMVNKTARQENRQARREERQIRRATPKKIRGTF